MNRGTEFVEVLAESADFVAGEIFKRPVEQTLSLYDSLIQWLSEWFITADEDTPKDRASHRRSQGGRAAGLPGQMRIGRSGYLGALSTRLDQVRIPRLDRIRVRLEGRPSPVHEAESVRRKPRKTVETAVPAGRRPSKPVREPVPKEAAVVVEKISPTLPESLKKPAPTAVATAVPPPPKPLKVIRRRQEEEPKVFETPPRHFPKAMLEGISSTPEEMGEYKGNH